MSDCSQAEDRIDRLLQELEATRKICDEKQQRIAKLEKENTELRSLGAWVMDWIRGKAE